MSKFTAFLLIFLAAAGVFADAKVDIAGIVEWDTLRIKAAVSLDLSSADIKLPSGRTHAESILKSSYTRLIQPGLLQLQVDSSSTIADLINRGEFSLQEVEAIALKAQSVPPALSPDLRKLFSSYVVPINGISAALLRHSRPAQIMRTLNPVSAPRYTGIIIIATENLPVHGMKASALPVPCLFPKIWDSELNLVYEHNMLETNNTAMVRYAPLESIFARNPSGLEPELAAFIGDRPLRIFARGVFGIKPTDLIIERSDALLVISSEENRRLLAEGKVAIILDDSVLRYEFNN